MALKKYSAISLFSGAMGLDIGLERSGRFRVLACVESEHAFCETIRRNRDNGLLKNRNLRVYEEDITKVDPLQLLRDLGLRPGQLDLLIGGPPCQSFSTAGRRGTVMDPRGTLIWQFLRFIQTMRPRFFLMENVRGLLSAALRHRPIKERPEKGGPPLKQEELPGSVVRLFASDLQAIGYRFDCFEVNAVNYGAPQLRERAIFIGNRFGAVVDFPDPTHGNHHAAEQQQRGLFDSRNGLLPYRTLGDAIKGIVEQSPVIMDFSPRKKRYLALVPSGSNWRSLPPQLQRESMGEAWRAKGGRSGWWRRLSYDLPCPTIVTMPNHAGTSLCHPEEIRALTLRECALVQEFPEGWEFVGRPLEQYTQVGNAVPVRLGQVASLALAGHMDALTKTHWKTHRAALVASRVVYVQSHIRTRQWYRDGEVKVWNDGRKNRTAAYSRPKTLRSVRIIT